MEYASTVLSLKQPLEADNIADLLGDKGLEVEKHDTHVEYRGDRFDYVFWYGSIVQRDYGGNASRDDFEAWKIVIQKIEDDIEFPHTVDPELPYKLED